MKAFDGCAGFGGVDIVLREFGFEVTAVEINDAIAEVNRRNGGEHCLTADLLDVDPSDYVGWRLFHFSPPCPRFSLARNSKPLQPVRFRVLDLARHQRLVNGETEQDIRLARKISDFIRLGRPEYFTLENVWQYRNSLSWLIIWYTLQEEGYGVDAWHLNAADYGVPQSRRRMIVIARRDGRRPMKPWPTHSKAGDLFTKPWRGWYEAIEDLLPGLPESRFAPWQEKNMPDKLRSFLIPGANTSNGTIRFADRTLSKQPHRAFLLGQGSRSELKLDTTPADTVTANSNQSGIKAFIADSANSRSNKGQMTGRADDEPMFTVTAMGKIAFFKAFIIGGKYQTPSGSERTVQNRGRDRPDWTITASEHGDTRAWLTGGKVVAVTPRCLARFQDFPDSFILPGEFDIDDPAMGDWLLELFSARELACRGIGNALPPGLYRAVLRSLDFKMA